VSYGGTLSETIKRFPNEKKIVDDLSNRADASWKLAREIRGCRKVC